MVMFDPYGGKKHKKYIENIVKNLKKSILAFKRPFFDVERVKFGEAFFSFLNDEFVYMPFKYGDFKEFSLFNKDKKIKFGIEKIFFPEIDVIEKDVIKKTAELINKGKVVAVFFGQREIGPRALGNRSILASPSIDKDYLNKIKGRELFRPFAPSVLKEFVNEYFYVEKYSDSLYYMLITVKVRQEKIREIPALVHVDGTSRIQMVDNGINPEYYKLISEFYKISDIPMVLNTSFNLAGMPIVDTPFQAIVCFFNSKIDALFIENYLLLKK
jgi:carbamoyltransferase